MTTIHNEAVTSAVCGESSSQTAIASTNAFGSPDLDTRPPEMQRSTISSWVQNCPECGFCARHLYQAGANAKAIVDSSEYRNQVTSPAFPTLANEFLCLRMLSEGGANLHDAAWASIHAAWACDYDSQDEAAAKCRNEAVRLITTLHAQNEFLAPQAGADEAILTDLLRRAARFDDALSLVDAALPETSDELIQKVLLFQKALISGGDVGAYRIEDAERGHG